MHYSLVECQGVTFLEQIQFLFGHASVLTTERYLGCKQNLEEPVNDRVGCLFTRTHSICAKPC
jgi:hypothetical protein